jgi:hypothetical protein
MINLKDPTPEERIKELVKSTTDELKKEIYTEIYEALTNPRCLCCKVELNENTNYTLYGISHTGYKLCDNCLNKIYPKNGIK